MGVKKWLCERKVLCDSIENVSGLTGVKMNNEGNCGALAINFLSVRRYFLMRERRLLAVKWPLAVTGCRHLFILYIILLIFPVRC